MTSRYTDTIEHAHRAPMGDRPGGHDSGAGVVPQPQPVGLRSRVGEPACASGNRAFVTGSLASGEGPEAGTSAWKGGGRVYQFYSIIIDSYLSFYPPIYRSRR